jgi:hypothetical protein
VKLAISDAHKGLKAAITRVVGATWQRCRVHFMRNALAHVPKGQTIVVAAAIRQVFLQLDPGLGLQSWRHVADQLRPRWSKLDAHMDGAEADVSAYMAFPSQLRGKVKAHTRDRHQPTRDLVLPSPADDLRLKTRTSASSRSRADTRTCKVGRAAFGTSVSGSATNATSSFTRAAPCGTTSPNSPM